LCVGCLDRGQEFHCLRDLGKFLGRRKTFECPSERALGVSGAAKSFDRAWRATTRHEVRSCGPFCCCATPMAARKAASARAGPAGFCLRRISPRMRWSLASNQCSPVSLASARGSGQRPRGAGGARVTCNPPIASRIWKSTARQGQRRPSVLFPTT
jgi:hypothetical protein